MTLDGSSMGGGTSVGNSFLYFLYTSLEMSLVSEASSVTTGPLNRGSPRIVFFFIGGGISDSKSLRLLASFSPSSISGSPSEQWSSVLDSWSQSGTIWMSLL